MYRSGSLRPLVIGSVLAKFLWIVEVVWLRIPLSWRWAVVLQSKLTKKGQKFVYKVFKSLVECSSQVFGKRPGFGTHHFFFVFGKRSWVKRTRFSRGEILECENPHCQCVFPAVYRRLGPSRHSLPTVPLSPSSGESFPQDLYPDSYSYFLVPSCLSYFGPLLSRTVRLRHVSFPPSTVHEHTRSSTGQGHTDPTYRTPFPLLTFEGSSSATLVWPKVVPHHQRSVRKLVSFRPTSALRR